MSVGGKVTEVIVKENSVYIDTIDHGVKCAIYVERNDDSERVSLGDSVWWQGRSAYWSTASRTVLDRAIKRIGYSGVPHPYKYH